MVFRHVAGIAWGLLCFLRGRAYSVLPQLYLIGSHSGGGPCLAAWICDSNISGSSICPKPCSGLNLAPTASACACTSVCMQPTLQLERPLENIAFMPATLQRRKLRTGRVRLPHSHTPAEGREGLNQGLLTPANLILFLGCQVPHFVT